MSTSTLDLDDTTTCPVADVCAGCGLPGDDLTVATAGTQLGVVCLAMCERCADAGIVPVYSAAGALRAVLAHCEHLGCDVDQMAAAMGGEQQ